MIVWLDDGRYQEQCSQNGYRASLATLDGRFSAVSLAQFFVTNSYRLFNLSRRSESESTGMQEIAIVNERLVWLALEQELDIFGTKLKNAVILDLESRAGHDKSRGPRHIDLGLISESLKKFLALDGYELVMLRVIRKVEELSIPMVP
jgi:hypothetical protein